MNTHTYHNFLPCAKAEIYDLTVYIVLNGEKSCHDLDLGRTIFKVFHAISIYYNYRDQSWGLSCFLFTLMPLNINFVTLRCIQTILHCHAC